MGTGSSADRAREKAVCGRHREHVAILGRKRKLTVQKQQGCQLGVGPHTCNHSPEEAEVGGSP